MNPLPLCRLVLTAEKLVRRAREDRLESEDLSDGTFLSNLDEMRIDAFDAIINAQSRWRTWCLAEPGDRAGVAAAACDLRFRWITVTDGAR